MCCPFRQVWLEKVDEKVRYFASTDPASMVHESKRFLQSFRDRVIEKKRWTTSLIYLKSLVGPISQAPTVFLVKRTITLPYLPASGRSRDSRRIFEQTRNSAQFISLDWPKYAFGQSVSSDGTRDSPRSLASAVINARCERKSYS